MMNQSPLSPAIPWYRTRLFWGVVLGIVFLWVVVFYYLTFPHNRDFLSSFIDFSMAGGSALFTFIGLDLAGQTGRILFTLAYDLIAVFLLYKTFSQRRVNLLYPIVFLGLFMIGSYLILQVVAGLN